MLPRLSDAALNISGSINNTGNVRFHLFIYIPLRSGLITSDAWIQMFEKFSRSDIDIGGTGGEYTVQVRLFSSPPLLLIPKLIPQLTVQTGWFRLDERRRPLGSLQFRQRPRSSDVPGPFGRTYWCFVKFVNYY